MWRISSARHAPVQAERRDQVDVLDSGLRGHVDDLFHDQLAHVRRRHRRQREREVVEGDGQFHAATQERLQRVVVERLGQRALDGPLGVGDRIERIGRIDDAGAERELLQPHAFAEMKEHRRGVAIDLDYSTRTRHYALNPRRSNATFTAPSLPALIA